MKLVFYYFLLDNPQRIVLSPLLPIEKRGNTLFDTCDTVFPPELREPIVLVTFSAPVVRFLLTFPLLLKGNMYIGMYCRRREFHYSPRGEEYSDVRLSPLHPPHCMTLVAQRGLISLYRSFFVEILSKDYNETLWLPC